MMDSDICHPLEKFITCQVLETRHGKWACLQLREGVWLISEMSTTPVMSPMGPLSGRCVTVGLPLII